jgi:glutamate dehydrogenase
LIFINMKEMQKVIDQIFQFAPENSKTTDNLLSKYINIFFSGSVKKDFDDYKVEELFNLASSSFNFFSQKPANNFKVQLYNPSKTKDGFDFPYTILNIVNDDMPFLVDSVVMQFDNLDIEIRNIIHPILTTKRSSDGTIISFVKESNDSNESVIQLHLSKISDDQLSCLETRITQILHSVKMAVQDWQKMLDLAKKSGKNLTDQNSNISSKNSINNVGFDIVEAASFIDWVVDNKFILLGAIEFGIEVKNGNYSYKEVPESRLGIYKSEYEITKPTIVNVSSEEIEDVVKNPYLVEILKSRYKSQIHRHSNAERIRIQKFDSNGKVIGEYRFIGLFTSSVYYQNPKSIPIVRKKIEQVIATSGFGKNSSSYKDLLSTLESYPRDELFQIDQEDLLRIAVGIVAISGRSLVRLFVRKDKFSRFISCLVFIPRDNFNTSLREKIQDLITAAYKGETTDVFVQIADSNLTRLHLMIRTENGIPEVNVDDLESDLIKICRLWNDDFKDEVLRSFSAAQSNEILNLYEDAFSVSYTNRFNAKAAVLDVNHINSCIHSGNITCDLYQTSQVPSDIVELKLYSPEKKLLLSNIMPVLDSFGFNVVLEHTYFVSVKGKKDVWIHYFNLNLSAGGETLTKEIKTNFIETISKIWSNDTKVGHLNRLVVSSNLSWRQIYVLRAYSKYLYQVGLRYSQNHLSDVLVKYRDLTKLLIELFETKFNPDFTGDREKSIKNISDKINDGLSKISDIAEDAIVRRFFNIIQSTLRTNFYQKTPEGRDKDYLSFKLDSAKILNLPLPVMYAEIFVYSVKVEGIHLRGGKVARGGLRWSDRQDDFRTEVLGLVKAQMTKNAVIVPVGSKGGFVVKKSTEGLNREQILENGIDCYKTFLRGLLDLTDNVVDGKITNPQNVVRYDDNDPYLVVAADKGTATFSDIANGISAEYNFWLGDAFASGGSVGYDHKKMGITAKGAWVAVRRHFSEIGIDIQNQDFTCVGIGDLSGDVFGNGMLLSKHTKLIAAFNHLHIFIDPNPDAASSFTERERMFNLPRSTWLDYDKSKISKGGGVFERSAKTISLSTEAKQALSIDKDELTPNELISLILKAPVDLLWNGGIGTYVKSSDESHLDVGDRVNDVLRINGVDLRCKVVGEGGNLGFTQKGRIEASFKGVKMNTDAMDNSAGVDCSDHEVNIKIALIAAMKAGKISLEERNKILEEMTEEVSQLVLADNKNQTGAISASHSGGYLSLGNQAQFLNSLEQSGALNREVEFLPTNKEIVKRQADKVGMTRPELCVMLAYSKMDLYPQILASKLVKDPYLKPELFNYFPKLLQEKFPDEITNHQLSSEIIATSLTNSIVNKAGITFVNQIASDTGFLPVDIVRSFIIVCDAFALDEIWHDLEQLGGKIPADIRAKIISGINKLLERGVVWLLRHQQKTNIATAIIKYGSIIKQLYEILDDILAKASKDSFNRKIILYSEAGVPLSLARRVAAMDPMASSFDIAEIARKSDFNIKIIAKIYFEVGTRFDLKWLRSRVSSINVDTYWKKLSLKTILEDLYYYQMKLTKQIVDFSCLDKDSCPAEASLDYWIKNNNVIAQRYDSFISELKEEQFNIDLPMFVVALNRVKALV